LNKFAKNSEYIYKHLTNLNLHINNIAEFVSLNLLIIIVVINGAEIITRTWLPGSLYWVFELNQLFGNWLYFIGITLVYYRNDDISIDFLTNKLSFKLRNIVIIIIRLIVLFVLIVISYYCVDLMILQSQARTVGLGITNHYFSLPVFISSVLMILYMFEHILVLYINTNENLGK
jgi:TRAP-type C4-dicarboxylate transport system permease small subunit